MGLDFGKVKDIHLAEKQSTSLSRVESDFYTQLKELVDEERERLRKKIESSGVGIDPMELYRFKNLKTLIKEIISIRAQKVTRMAIADAFASSNSSTEHMVEWEEGLYWGVRREVEKVISRVLGEEEGRAFNLVHVRILTDIPVFVGPDLREYGPFRAGEETPLPKEVAEILVKKNQAEVIE